MTASFDFSVQYQVTDSGVGEAKGKAKGGDGGWLMAFAEAMGKLMQKQVEKIQDFADSIGDKPTPSDSTAQFFKLNQADCRLHFGHPVIAAKAVMQPAEAVAGQRVHDLVRILAMIFPGPGARPRPGIAQQQHATRSEEHTSELPSLMRISYAVFCLQQKTHK